LYGAASSVLKGKLISREPMRIRVGFL